jgi:MFS family permease
LWIARIMVTWGLISAGMMFIQGERSFYIMRFLLGVAEAGFLPGIIYYLSQWFPSAVRARAVSWFMIAIPLSIVIGGPLSGLLLEMDGILGLQGWQWMFLIEGLPAVFLGFVVLVYLTDTPAQARWLTSEEREWLSAHMQAEHASAHDKYRVSLRQALLHPTVWKLALIMFAFQTASYGLTLWVPQIVKSWSGLSDLKVGMISAIPYVGAALGMVLIGISSDRHRERFLHIAIPSAIGAVGFVACAYVISPVAGIIALTVAAVGDYSTRGPFWALPGRFLAGSAAAAGIALINTRGALGGFVGPYLVGFLKSLTGSFESSLLCLALILLLGAVGTMRLRATAD